MLFVDFERVVTCLRAFGLSSPGNFGQHHEVDVRSRENRQRSIIWSQRVLNSSGYPERCRGFDDRPLFFPQILDRLTDLIIRNGDALVNQMSAQFKRDFSWTGDGGSVAESIERLNGGSLPTGERNSHAILINRFDNNQFCGWKFFPDHRSNTRGHSPSPDFEKDMGGRFCNFVSNFLTNGCLTGDDLQIVVGWNHNTTGGFRESKGFGGCIVE